MEKTNTQRGFAVGIAIGIIALLSLIGGRAYVVNKERATANANATTTAQVNSHGWFSDFFGINGGVDTSASATGTRNATENADINAGINSNADVNTNASTTHAASSSVDVNVKTNLNY
jgi:hypothetical protein